MLDDNSSHILHIFDKYNIKHHMTRHSLIHCTFNILFNYMVLTACTNTKYPDCKGLHYLNNQILLWKF